MSGRVVHLGIGAFARAHPLVYTARAGGWRVTAFTGRSAGVAEALTAQGGRYGLIVRGPDGDDVEEIDVLDAVHPASDLDALRDAVADPATSVVTLTITEKGYAAGTDPAVSAPARLALALRARREAGVSEPIALVPCDNLSDNGQILRATVLAAADPGTRDWFDGHVDVVSTMVDRITPAAGDAERALVAERLGFADQVPVVTEPFHEWVIEDAFRGPRPAWEDAGAQLVPDVAVHERRKLRLLNGAHSLLAYAGPLRRHETVPQAAGDPRIAALVRAWWSEARRGLGLPHAEVDAYTDALHARFGNTRLADALSRIAQDGTAKLRVRILPVIAERGGPELSPAAVTVLAAWCARVTEQSRAGDPVPDPEEARIHDAARTDDTDRLTRLLSLLDPETAGLDPAALTHAVQHTALPFR